MPRIGGPALAVVAGCRTVQGPLEQAADRITEEDLERGQAWENLYHPCDRIGSRPGESESPDRAIERAMGVMRAAGLENVRRRPSWCRCG